MGAQPGLDRGGLGAGDEAAGVAKPVVRQARRNRAHRLERLPGGRFADPEVFVVRLARGGGAPRGRRSCRGGWPRGSREPRSRPRRGDARHGSRPRPRPRPRPGRPLRGARRRRRPRARRRSSSRPCLRSRGARRSGVRRASDRRAGRCGRCRRCGSSRAGVWQESAPRSRGARRGSGRRSAGATGPRCSSRAGRSRRARGRGSRRDRGRAPRSASKPSRARSSRPRSAPRRPSTSRERGRACASVVPGRCVRRRTSRPSCSATDPAVGGPHDAGQRQIRRSLGEPLERAVLEVQVLRPFRLARDLENEGAALGRELEILVALARKLPGRRREPVEAPREARRAFGVDPLHGFAGSRRIARRVAGCGTGLLSSRPPCRSTRSSGR